MGNTQEKKSIKVPPSALFELFDDDFAIAVVERACARRDKAPPDARKALTNAVRSGIKLNGFKDIRRAPANLLAPAVLDEIDHFNNRLAEAVLHVWDASHADLRKIVSDQLKTDGTPVVRRWRAFNTAENREDWLAQGDRLAEQHADHEKDDVLLMFWLASGVVPIPSEVEDAYFDSPRFQRWIDELEKLPIEAPEWLEANRFGALVAEMGEAKVATHIAGHVSLLAADIDSLREKFGEELRYLEIDTSSWAKNAEQRLSTLPMASGIVQGLKDHLKAYRPIRGQAALREEEKRRAAAREERETAILKLAAEWAELMSGPPDPPREVADQRAEYKTDGAEGEDDAAEVADLRSQVEKLQEENKRLEETHNEIAETLREVKAGIQLEKAQLSGEIGDLKNQLAQSRESEQYWRKMYASPTNVDAEDDTPVSFSNAAAAIAHAERAFPKQLDFSLNGKSEKNYPYQKPQEVFDALAWLATEYHRLRPNPGPSPDFDRMIKEACPGWSYKPNQTETTMGMYPEWYRTSRAGKIYDLANHIGKGNGRDPKNTIRIAFAWDEEDNCVVVGYIGRHQRNSQS